MFKFKQNDIIHRKLGKDRLKIIVEGVRSGGNAIYELRFSNFLGKFDEAINYLGQSYLEENYELVNSRSSAHPLTTIFKDVQV